MSQPKNKFSVYKPNKNSSGSAVQFDFNREKQCIFLEAARQVASQAQGAQQNAFDWENKIVFKLGLTDMGKLLAVLQGRIKSVDLFHDPSKGQYTLGTEVKNNAVSFSKGDYGYFLKVSSQGRDGKVSAIQISITEDEAALLQVLLAKAVEESLGW
jgi:hypothetical protein